MLACSSIFQTQNNNKAAWSCACVCTLIVSRLHAKAPVYQDNDNDVNMSRSCSTVVPRNQASEKLAKPVITMLQQLEVKVKVSAQVSRLVTFNSSRACLWWVTVSSTKAVLAGRAYRRRCLWQIRTGYCWTEGQGRKPKYSENSSL